MTDTIAEEAVAAASEADRYAGLFRAVYPTLAGWIGRQVEDDDTAHEIASEAFVRLLARRSRLDNPKGYLYVIAANLVRDHWRKTQRERRAMRSVAASAAGTGVACPTQFGGSGGRPPA